ncbi:MAG: hypothetical protein GQ570_08500 [Helicobacteraceae bacterium]|nr:hypothetical protein [Helicobacteraceae bacterium]
MPKEPDDFKRFGLKERRRIKSVKGAMWEKKLHRCNPFDCNDKEVISAKSQAMPNSGFVYSKFRDKSIDTLDEMTLSNWADGNAGKNKFPHLEIICTIVYVNKYMIPYLVSENTLDTDIRDILIDMGFISIKNL